MTTIKMMTIKGDDFQVITAEKTEKSNRWNIQGEYPWNFVDKAALTAHIIRGGHVPLWKDWKEE